MFERTPFVATFVCADVHLRELPAADGGADCALAGLLMIGKTIGKYRVLGRLGSGGMGTVYKAFDETLEREIALKVLNPGLTDPRILTRFRAEATTLAKLNHPAIATIYELFDCDGDLLIVMEFVRGETLEKLALRMGVLAPEQAVFIVNYMLSALAHSHRAGIVHCDIKPANVIVTAQGGVKVMDFGTARARGAEHGAAQGYMMGTPAYMPPEQLLGHQLDGRTDLYAVGVVFYRLVTGTLPFTADTPIEAMRKQIADAPTPAIEHCPDLPDWCDHIVTRALEKAPTDRFQTAEEFRDALRDASGLMTAEPTRLFLAPMVDAPEGAREPTVVEDVEPSVPEMATGPTVRVAPNTWIVRTSLSQRSRVAGPFAVFVAVAVSFLAVNTLRAPSSNVAEPRSSGSADASASESVQVPELATTAPASARPTPQSSEPVADKTTPGRTPVVYAFDARVVAGNQKSPQECKCRVLLTKDRIIWRADGDRRRIDAVAYDHVASIVYSHGRDPLWNGPSGPTAVVRASRNPFAALGFFSERDWLSVRVTDPRLRFVVLRFDDGAQARSAINALEERTGRRIERLSKRQS